MEDYKYLQRIKQISPENKFINYIIDRVLSDDYRGFQCSQHNKLTFPYFSAVINTIYEIAGQNIFGIHVGDDNGIKQTNAFIYYDIVQTLNSRTGKCTINSLKKNTFPDIARMGFLDRYDKYGNKITEDKKCGVYSVSLSITGIKFAVSEPFEKIKLFTAGVDILTKNTAIELVELLYLNDFGIDSIDLLEYMYIFSDDRPLISYNDKIGLLIEYRRLTSIEKNILNESLQGFCNPSNRKFLNNKTLLRDYNNWKNESQQIFCLLSNSTYFKVENNKLILNTGNYGLFDENIQRGQKAKLDYFKNHNIQKQPGFDLHHIVPFSKAQNKSDAIFIDNFKNLIYLNDSKHSEFTISGSKNVIMKYTANNPSILFMTFDDSFILVDIKKDALFSEKLLPVVKEYNNFLLKKFYLK